MEIPCPLNPGNFALFVEINPYFVSSDEQFVKFIEGDYKEWYVGLTNDPKHNLMTIHRVNLDDGDWAVSSSCTEDVLESIKKMLISKGCLNIKELDMDDPDRLYLYHIKPGTRETVLTPRKF